MNYEKSYIQASTIYLLQYSSFHIYKAQITNGSNAGKEESES